jgi:hypothetical protein
VDVDVNVKWGDEEVSNKKGHQVRQNKEQMNPIAGILK